MSADDRDGGHASGLSAEDRDGGEAAGWDCGQETLSGGNGVFALGGGSGWDTCASAGGREARDAGFVLRPYQVHALRAVRDGLDAGHLRQVVQMATGAGKTALAAEMVRMTLAAGMRAWFVVDRIALVDQTARAFRRHGIDLGIVQADHPYYRPDAPAQVVSIQTWARSPHRAWNRNLGLIVIDECHVLHAAHRAMMAEHPDVPVVGLSATPFAAGLGKHYDRLIVGASTAQLTADGYLVPAVCYGPAEPDMAGVKVARGDYAAGDLARLMDRPKLIADVVQTWARHASERPTIVFASSVAHSEHLAESFRGIGVTAAHIDAYTEAPDRTKAIKGFKRGAVQVLCSVGVLTTGFDAPNAGCVVLARPTQSLMLHLQMIGRGLRTDDGKRDCLVLDHAGNIARLGLPTDPTPDELSTGDKTAGAERKAPERLPKPCQNCAFLRPPGVHACPACGFEPKKQNAVEVAPGELRQITGRKRASNGALDRGAWHAMLCGYAQQKGYARGWVGHAYREMFGVWPRGERSPLAPSAACLAWIKSRQIRAAKTAAPLTPLERLQRAGVRLRIEGETLRAGPREAITDDIAAYIREHRATLTAALAKKREPERAS